ncbi:ankyrin repeat domain-containing protein 18A-like protein [Cricetulus griseus]|nr:ankyrin repeat domain-containing protein 18A-like protein [Cricetulus griseus]
MFNSPLPPMFGVVPWVLLGKNERITESSFLGIDSLFYNRKSHYEDYISHIYHKPVQDPVLVELMVHLGRGLRGVALLEEYVLDKRGDYPSLNHSADADADADADHDCAQAAKLSKADSRKDLVRRYGKQLPTIHAVQKLGANDGPSEEPKALPLKWLTDEPVWGLGELVNGRGYFKRLIEDGPLQLQPNVKGPFDKAEKL